MGAKFVFTLKTDAKRRQLPYKILLAQQENETSNHILLKVLAYLLFFRERIEIEGKLHNENIPFSPAIRVQRPLVRCAIYDIEILMLYSLGQMRTKIRCGEWSRISRNNASILAASGSTSRRARPSVMSITTPDAAKKML